MGRWVRKNQTRELVLGRKCEHTVVEIWGKSATSGLQDKRKLMTTEVLRGE